MHCDYPRWVEWLCHDINWHVPHHVNSKIPWYNLRPATESLRQNWGEVRPLTRIAISIQGCGDFCGWRTWLVWLILFVSRGLHST